MPDETLNFKVTGQYASNISSRLVQATRDRRSILRWL